MRVKTRMRHGSHRMRPEDLRLAIIPLVDVVFLLLLYFVMAGSFAEDEKRLATALATDSSGSRSAEFIPQRVRVSWVEDHAVWTIGERITADRGELRGILVGLPRDVGLIVAPDRDAPLEATAAAVQIARDLGFDKLSYVSPTRGATE